ncbi:MAG: hypothetical protein JG770_1040 [Mahella sp.]|nr:hypothetical protein [Mahella sp.]
MKRIFMAAMVLALSIALLSGCGLYVRSGDEEGSDWVGTDFDVMDFDFDYGKPAFEQAKQQSFDGGKVSKVDIESDNAIINVEAYTGNEIQIEYRKQIYGKNVSQQKADELMGEISVSIEQIGDSIVIKAETGDKMAFGINIPDKVIRLDIKMPADKALVLKNGSGMIDINGLAEDIDIINGSAMIDLMDITGNIEIETGNGMVTLDTASIKDLSLKSGNGMIDASINELAGDSYDINTGNGMVILKLGQNASADFTITTTNGAVNADIPLTKNGRTYRGSLNGGGPNMNISTGNGMVSVSYKE